MSTNAVISSRKATVLAYFDGFRRGDHEAILALLTDDVVWDLYGHTHLDGKQQFDREIENEGFQGSPELIVDRVIEEGDTIVVPHVGKVRRSDGALFTFAACDVFTFAGELICRVESYVVPTDASALSTPATGQNQPRTAGRSTGRRHRNDTTIKKGSTCQS